MNESHSDSDYVVEDYIRPLKFKKSINDDSADILGNFDDEKRRNIEENLDYFPANVQVTPTSEEDSSCSEVEAFSDLNGDNKNLSANQLEILLRGSYKKNRYVLYVTNLSFETNKENLKSHFETAGEVKCVRVPKNRKGCYAFIEMQTLDGFQKAFALHNTELDGKSIKVQISEGGKKKSANKKNILKQKNRKLAKIRNEEKAFNKSGKNYDKDIKKEKMKEFALRNRWRKKPQKA
ncbi:uncharacterized protein LOC129613067 [Condylostylus longicornis]|uniref:uncharacterized protein LOC129613067 n=1 Tax=Condylostylus longicornis TaxID=2530218 RepID=UPI00244DCB55|nr:uncharacterized protein LOC129613067 [Condylostylus longicornis]